MKILELYSGIGGMHYALKAVDENMEVLLAVDINDIANMVYKHNFPAVNLRNTNIECLTPNEINKLAPDMILLSPPCQPFTRNGLQKDIQDARTSSFLHIINLLPHLNSIKYILLENVKGFEASQTRSQLLCALKTCNFKIKEYLLNSEQFNVCNSRLRYYLIGRKISLDNDYEQMKRHLPEDENNNEQIEINFPLKDINNEGDTITISKFLEFNKWNENNAYCLPLSLFIKYYSVLDIVGVDSIKTCCFTKAYSHYLHGTGSILSILSTTDVVKIKKEVTEKSGFVDSSYLLQKLNPRFFTPLEIARLMCFPPEFTFPSVINDKQKYRLLGNSVNVLVVSKLIHYLLTEFD